MNQTSGGDPCSGVVIDHFEIICHNSAHHNIRGDNHFDRMKDTRSDYSPLCLPYLPQGIWVNVIRPVGKEKYMVAHSLLTSE